MAAWQADFAVVFRSGHMPPDYRARLATVLPPSQSWSEAVEIWGSDQGDRIDVTQADSGEYDVLARFDLREWKPRLYARFLEFVRNSGGTLQNAPADAEYPPIPLTVEAFESALRASDAFRFVSDPERYLRSLSKETGQK